MGNEADLSSHSDSSRVAAKSKLDQSSAGSESDPISDSSSEVRSGDPTIPDSHGIQQGKTSILGSNGIHKAQAKYGRRKARHLQRYYTDDYRRLLNEEISNASNRTIWHSELDASGTEQVGLSRWTSIERTRLFDSLARLGIHDLQGISASIRTKSEPEVHVYLQLLRESAVELAEKSASESLTREDIPAAVEIGPECCKALDRSAEALELLQRHHEEADEVARRGALWLLTEKEVSWVKQQVEGGTSGQQVLEEKLPAANLLNLENFLHLSKEVFMNGSAESGKENCQTYVQGDEEEPSIRLAAFEDFHQLTLDITKRIIQTVIFTTLSRLRSMDYKYSNTRSNSLFKGGRDVLVGDVHAAISVLGLKHDSQDFWRTAARRNGLHVLDLKNSLSYDAVEQQLYLDDTGAKYEHSRGGDFSLSLDSMALDRIPATHGPFLANGDQSSVTDSEYLTDPEEAIQPSGDLPSATTSSSPSSPQRRTIQASSQTDLDVAEDAYIDALDTIASHAEEERLWQILGREPTIPRQKPIVIEQPTRSLKSTLAQRRWWDNFEFRPEWEVLAARRWHSVNPDTQRSGELTGEDEDGNGEEDGGSASDIEILVQRTQDGEGAVREKGEAEDDDLYDISSDEEMVDAEDGLESGLEEDDEEAGDGDG